jgi:hypothetical protein
MRFAQETTSMTEQTRKSILSAIGDCNRYIAKESARADDLRPADVQKRLEWYRTHRARLLAMVQV